MRAAYCSYRLLFKFKAITSRGELPYKDTYFIKVWDTKHPDKFGIGECALFTGLSYDDKPNYVDKLEETCDLISKSHSCNLTQWPSIRFGLETAIMDYENGTVHNPFPSKFSSGKKSITINGLVWMGKPTEMRSRAIDKIKQGFSCVKFKISNEHFEDEVNIIRDIRKRYPHENLTIRLDANGAFKAHEAIDRLKELAQFDIHSIEQPIAAGQPDELAKICRQSPIPIAIDEELISHHSRSDMRDLLSCIKPAFIILKPALCGGFKGACDWIECATPLGIRWWITSALESNIGLNAIAQWTATLGVTTPQGLGTGALFTNNIQSPLTLNGENLHFSQSNQWHFPDFEWVEP